MKALLQLIVSLILLVSSVSPVAAQSADDYHPFLSDKFNLGIGVFWPNINLDLQVDGSAPEDEIDFDEVLNLSDYTTSPVLNFRWRFGEKWSLLGQYWSTSNGERAVLPKDVSWGDVIFKEGTFVGGGVGLDVVRAFVGRKFDLAPQHEFGVGFGLHYMNLDTYLEGDIKTEDDRIEFYTGDASASFPLPNIGAWYMYSWSPKWVLMSHVDWLSATIGDYSGGLWDVELGVNYQAFKNVGFGLSYKAFILNVDVDKDDWHGKVDFTQAGPSLHLTATW
ncbi:MAG: hypothetical protein GY732_16010 [Gammaproteobacteria bacterium]|nr:hypothetical protein [Gammaproteobacteria bacterium]